MKDRSQFYKDLSEPFYGANREGSNVSQGAKDDLWRQGMLVNLAAAYDCIKAFSETDQTEDLRAIKAPIPSPPHDERGLVAPGSTSPKEPPRSSIGAQVLLGSRNGLPSGEPGLIRYPQRGFWPLVQMNFPSFTEM